MSGSNNGGTRRDFLGTTAAAGAALASGLALAPNVHAAGSDEIKVGVIGCGSRGTGAAENVMHAAEGVTLWALGDAFRFQAEDCQRHLINFGKEDEGVKRLGNKVELGDRVFHGLDAYQKVLDSGVNYVILATPPGFRPQHLEAAVAAGKNIFTEKPVGTDSPGLRKVFKAYEDAKIKGLAIAAGTQRRHQAPYIETIKRIHDGAIGDIVAGRCYWMQGILWARDRPDLKTPVEKQVYNWYNYTWVCGDHIVEQHVHNIDVLNWAIGTHPVAAVGMGYRTRTDPRFGMIYDFFAIDYEYPRGVHTLSMCRQISRCQDEIGEYLVGTKGQCHVSDYNINGKRVAGGRHGGDSQDQNDLMANWLATHPSLRDYIKDPYVQEHTDLIASIRAGKPINELKNVAESTLSAILGRMSAYTGKRVTWDQALNSREQLVPDQLTWQTQLPDWQLAIPGKTPLV
jgi:predicted dehydrogenase